MTWFKFDDNAVDHPKIATLSDRAFRWWIRGLSYASRFLTDGVLHPCFWKQVPKQSRAELSEKRLWDWNDPNFQIHDYLHHQMGKHEIELDKERNREKARAFRERRRVERRQNHPPSPVTSPVTQLGNVTDHITDNPTHNPTPNTQQTTTTPPRPLISGEANPRTWGKIHGEHVADFCDWVCLPEFIFAEFVRKSAGAEYVKGWARAVRQRFEGQSVGDNLKFWRARWSESHPEKVEASKPKLRPVAEIIAERERKTS